MGERRRAALERLIPLVHRELHQIARRYQKRGGDAPRVNFDEALVVSSQPRHDLVALDEALQALAAVDERKSRAIELRFFDGLTIEETASVLRVSRDTVLRDWQMARAWLHREMRGGHPDDD